MEGILAPLDLLKRDVERLQRAIGVEGKIPEPARLLPELPSGRRLDLIVMGAAADAAQFLIGAIPAVGDVLADIVVDNIEADMHRRFTPEERAAFIEQTRFLPSSLAAWRAVAKGAP